MLTLIFRIKNFFLALISYREMQQHCGDGWGGEGGGVELIDSLSTCMTIAFAFCNSDENRLDSSLLQSTSTLRGISSHRHCTNNAHHASIVRRNERMCNLCSCAYRHKDDTLTRLRKYPCETTIYREFDDVSSSAVCTHSFKRNIQALHPAYKWLYDICALRVSCDAKDNGKLCQKPNGMRIDRITWAIQQSSQKLWFFPEKNETKNRTRARTAQFPIYLFLFGFKFNSFCCFLFFLTFDERIKLN